MLRNLDAAGAAMAERGNSARESQALSTQRSTHAALTEQHALTTKAQAETASWLTAHTGHAVLAGNWKHVEYLLLAAEKAASIRQTAEQETLRLQQMETRASQDATRHATTLGKCLQARSRPRPPRNRPARNAPVTTRDALAQQKAEAENLRTCLHTAQSGWTQWQERQRELAAAEQEADALRQTRQISEAALQALVRQRPGWKASSAGRKCAATFLQTACNQDVDAPRATLRPDEACPVCGASDHPYADAGAVHALLELLKVQQGEHDALRRALDYVLSEETRHAATLKVQDQQLAALVLRAAGAESSP